MADSVLDLSPVVPVVVVDSAADAVPLAQALVRGGIRVIEVTLRTPAALHAIAAIASDVPDIVVGAGTVVNAHHAESALAAGAQFLVSPGGTPSLLAAMRATGLPLLPGCATVSEAMALVEQGFAELKFFPAEASGGAQFLSSVHGPLPSLRFCPTGGITADTAASYLSLPNVACVGGSWLTPPDVVRARNWSRIEELAAKAAALQRVRT